ncbi:hypothetical protein PHMEG_0008006 [Phytophthora megakarya]|uniref:Uncharacterized protein n=1 Tax=Phytophthora megakarya TaxID=4795 RepID=A0A225WLT4_9STRA|nr:hypothetical protein PHMEG_0008006 [Phytophthora megakarya]
MECAEDEGESVSMSDENHNGLNVLFAMPALPLRQTAVVLCNWKGCKKIDKVSGGGDICRCERQGCERVVHKACSTSMLAQFCADSAFSKTPCGKRCYNALMKQPRSSTTQVKKRVPWHNDGPTPDISSISILIDWLTEGNNYSRYRGGDAESGETKTTIAGEIASRI